jgi:hypothetical protein
LHTGLRVQRAPGIPHALFFLGKRFLHNSGASRRGIADVHLQPSSPAKAGDPAILPLRGEMDCFASLAMTVDEHHVVPAKRSASRDP